MLKFLKTTALGSMALVMVAVSAPASLAADSLEIRDFIGSINWSNGAISVDVQKNAGDTTISGRRSMIVDGNQSDIDGSECKSSYGRYDIDWFGKKKEGRFGGYEDLKNFPVLDISLPEDTKLIIRNSIVFTEGTPNIGDADLEINHCGEVTLGDVEGVMALDSRGSADVDVGVTGQIVANLKGSGDLTGGDSNEVLIKSHGSADVELGNITSLEVSMHGSGDLEMGDVEGAVDLSSHGSGDVDLGDVGGSLSYSGHGSGDLEISSVNGERLDLESRGSGDVDIGGGNVGKLTATVRGSASIDYSGEAQTAALKASGSGDIYINRVTGDVDIRTSGSGDVDIDERG